MEHGLNESTGKINNLSEPQHQSGKFFIPGFRQKPVSGCFENIIVQLLYRKRIQKKKAPENQRLINYFAVRTVPHFRVFPCFPLIFK